MAAKKEVQPLMSSGKKKWPVGDYFQTRDVSHYSWLAPAVKSGEFPLWPLWVHQSNYAKLVFLLKLYIWCILFFITKKILPGSRNNDLHPNDEDGGVYGYTIITYPFSKRITLCVMVYIYRSNSSFSRRFSLHEACREKFKILE